MSFFERTIFFKQMAFIPYLYALDGMRRVWLGGTNLAFFIDLAAGYQVPPLCDLDRMQLYITQEQALWNTIPPHLQLPLTPFIDYTKACQAILDMFNGIKEQFPEHGTTCQEIRDRLHPPEPSLL